MAGAHAAYLPDKTGYGCPRGKSHSLLKNRGGQGLPEHVGHAAELSGPVYGRRGLGKSHGSPPDLIPFASQVNNPRPDTDILVVRTVQILGI